jgi:hypothetical protein
LYSTVIKAIIRPLGVESLTAGAFPSRPETARTGLLFGSTGQIPEPTVKRPWRRLLRISVRNLMILVLLLGGVMSWMVHAARVQRDAVNAIRHDKGHVLYNWDFRDGKLLVDNRLQLSGRPWAPRWLVDLVGCDYFGHVQHVRFQSARSSLRHVERLRQLETLDLYPSETADSDLAYIRNLTNLRQLVLWGPKISDAGLKHLKKLTKVETLRLVQTNIKTPALPA